MQIQPQIIERNCELKEYVKEQIRERIHQLETYFDRITSCTVKVESGPKREKGKHVYSVAIDLGVPNTVLVVNRQPSADLPVAIREAFDAIRRELEDYVRKMRGSVKAHEPELYGRVVRIFTDDDYGFLESDAGDEVYFHRNSVLDGDFDEINIGSTVRYNAEVGEKGLQATAVHAQK